MVSKIIDVRTSRNGEIVDALSANKADGAVISSIITLAEPGDEVLLIVKTADKL